MSMLPPLSVPLRQRRQVSLLHALQPARMPWNPRSAIVVARMLRSSGPCPVLSTSLLIACTLACLSGLRTRRWVRFVRSRVRYPPMMWVAAII
eukprot:4453834-Pyramimonas_sp.AAC.1